MKISARIVFLTIVFVCFASIFVLAGVDLMTDDSSSSADLVTEESENKSEKTNNARIIIDESKLYQNMLRIVKGETSQILTEGYDNVKFSTGNKKIATVTKDGIVEAKKAGTTTIYVKAYNTFTQEKINQKIKVFVPTAIKSVSLYKSTFTYTGDEIAPKIYRINNKKLSSVDSYTIEAESGTSVKPGTYYLVVNGINKYCGQYKCKYVIKKASQSISVDTPKVNTEEPVKLMPSAQSTGEFSYKSKNNKIATVSETGVITGIKCGTTYITIYNSGDENYNSASKTIKITVTSYKPIVGITSTDRANISQCKELIKNAGGEYQLLPYVRSVEEAEMCLDMYNISALLIPGGGDIIPSVYGQETTYAYQYEFLEERDTSELALFQAAVKRDLPVLGICRGYELISVASGGELYQDVMEMNIASISHKNGVNHYIAIEENSILASIMGSGLKRVNSYHHQAVNPQNPGENIKITAYSTDGVVEAIERNDCTFVVGVLSHMEQPGMRKKSGWSKVATALVNAGKNYHYRNKEVK